MTLSTAGGIGRRIFERFHANTERIRHEQILATTWRWRLGAWLETLARDLKSAEPIEGRQGIRLRFVQTDRNLGYPVYSVRSVRGDLHMGKLEWRNQWRRPSFKADADAIFDQQCIAEIFAMMKGFK